jgi:hypothetical protein
LLHERIKETHRHFFEAIYLKPPCQAWGHPLPFQRP